MSEMSFFFVLCPLIVCSSKFGPVFAFCFFVFCFCKVKSLEMSTTVNCKSKLSALTPRAN